MNTIKDYLQQAELALAAYSTLTVGTPRTDALIDQGRGMSATQAAQFAATYTVVAQYTDPIFGVSATVFQQGNQKYLAIRGTQGPTDFLADYLILQGVPSQLNPQYLTLKAQVNQWMADGTLTAFGAGGCPTLAIQMRSGE